MFPLVFAVIAFGGALGVGVFLFATHHSAAAAGKGTATDQVAADSGAGEGADRPGGAGGPDGPRARDSSALGVAGRRLSRAGWSAGASVGARVSRRSYPARAQRLLDLAGAPSGWTPQKLLAARGLGLLAGATLGLLTGARHGAQIAGLFTAAFALLLAAAPDLVLRRRGEKRQEQIRRELPNAMDMLTVCVEAGMGFDAALTRVARTTDGPFADECSRLLQEMNFGMARTDALRALVGRTEVPELRSFVAAMVQATEVGISIGDVLREQSRQMRISRRQRAEEKAQKMQVKLLLPLITCLLPAMFIVVLGPAVIHLAQFFSTAK